MKKLLKSPFTPPVAASLLILLGWLPFLLKSGYIPDNTDWHSYMQFSEAARIDILDYGQFPFWNPWHYGGTPLAARPQFGVFSLDTLFTLIFGTLRGFHFAIMVYVLAGAWGMWLLLGDFVKNQAARFWGMLLFGLQGTIAIHIAAGHTVMTAIIWLPWLIYCARRVPRSLPAGLALGALAGLMLNQSIHYLTIISCPITGLFVLYALYAERKKLKEGLRNLTGALLVFGTLASFNLILTWNLVHNFKRIIPFRITLNPVDFLLGLIYPGQHAYSFPPGPLPGWWNWHEMGCYVGLLACLLFIWSFYKELRWWHWGFLLTFPLVIDSDIRFLPGFWLRELPGFSSMWVITRWRFFTLFFLIIGAARGLDLLIAPTPQKYLIASVIIPISCLGLIYTQWSNWRVHTGRPEAYYTRTIPYRGKPIVSSGKNYLNQFVATRNGVAMLFSHDPLLGYESFSKGRSLRIAVEDRRYRGEIWTLQKIPLQRKWTPNMITLSAPLDCLVVINQNPGCYWQLNNKPLFPDARQFETEKHFILKLKANQQYILKIQPPGLGLALTVTGCFAIALLLYLLKYQRELTPGKRTAQAAA
jgi:hypothetical protein